MAQPKFKRGVIRWAQRNGIEINTTLRNAAVFLHTRIVRRTPIDTGRARASWNIVAGSERDNRVAPADFQGGADGAESVAATKRAALGPGNEFTISNALPYIEALENGHSQQAPAGMVRLAIAETRSRLATGRRLR